MASKSMVVIIPGLLINSLLFVFGPVVGSVGIPITLGIGVSAFFGANRVAAVLLMVMLNILIFIMSFLAGIFLAVMNLFVGVRLLVRGGGV